MKNIFRVLLFVTLSFSSFSSFSQTRIVVLGSSTAAGEGASVTDSSWVGRLQLYYRKNTTAGNPDTIVTNLAIGGFNSYRVMPDNYVPPPNRPAPVPSNNVTKALSYNPEVIIINLPSNDISDGFSAQEFMNNLRFLFQHINSAGPRVFITTTQPRTWLSDEQRQTLRNLVDSINNNFGVYAIDFWTDLVTNDGQNRLKTEVGSGDGTHLNDYGHRLVFQKVIAENLFATNAPLPVKITSFKGRYLNNGIEVLWTTAFEENGTRYTIQRSSDGVNFTDLHSQPGRAQNGNGSYSWIDINPASGINYYRIKVQEGTKTTYSLIISISKEIKPLGIKRLYKESPSVLVAEVTSEKNSNAFIMIYSMNGQILFRERVTLVAGIALLRLPVQHLASGQYLIHIKAGNREVSQAFVK